MRFRALVIASLAACSGGGGGGGGDSDAQVVGRCGDGTVDPGEQCDDGNAIAGDGCTLCVIDGQRMAAIDATWHLATVAGAVAACPSTDDTAAVISQPVDGTGANAGAAVIDLFDCAAGLGATAPLPATTYSARISITDHAMTQAFATSLAQPVDLSDATNKPLDATFLTDGGVFALTWKLVKMSDASPLTCDDVSAMSRVRVATLNTSTMVSSSASFPCSDAAAVTSPLVAGTYTVTVSALSNLFANKGSAPPLMGQLIVAPNGVTDLGAVTIPITGL